MKNILVFDSSSSNLFISGEVNGAKIEFCRNYEKSKMSVEMPGDMMWLRDVLAGSENIRVVAGAGPGSFTGIKSGLSFFLALVYSLGIKKVETVSSSRLFAVFSKAPSGVSKIVAIPFNKGEYFISVYDREQNPLMEDVFMRFPFEGFADKANVLNNLEAVIVSPVDVCEELVSELGRFFKIKGIYAGSLVFEQEKMPAPGQLKTVDIPSEPMILNYVTHPANIDGNCDIYVKN